jgi:hypothetical protein
MCSKDAKPRFEFPPPREMTDEVVERIVEESAKCRREFEELTRPMEAIEEKDLQVRAR